MTTKSQKPGPLSADVINKSGRISFKQFLHQCARRGLKPLWVSEAPWWGVGVGVTPKGLPRTVPGDGEPGKKRSEVLRYLFAAAKYCQPYEVRIYEPFFSNFVLQLLRKDARALIQDEAERTGKTPWQIIEREFKKPSLVSNAVERVLA